MCSVAQPCLTLCDAMDRSQPVSSVHGISQANTGVSGHSLHGVFLTQGQHPSLLCLLHWQAGSLPLWHLGSPQVLPTCGSQKTLADGGQNPQLSQRLKSLSGLANQIKRRVQMGQEQILNLKSKLCFSMHPFEDPKHANQHLSQILPKFPSFFPSLAPFPRTVLNMKY